MAEVRSIKRPSKAGTRGFIIKPQAAAMKQREEKRVEAVSYAKDKRLSKYNPAVRKYIDNPNYDVTENPDGSMVIQSKEKKEYAIRSDYNKIRQTGKYIPHVITVNPAGGVTEKLYKDYGVTHNQKTLRRKIYNPYIKQYDAYGQLVIDTQYDIYTSESGKTSRPKLESVMKYQGGELAYSKEKEYENTQTQSTKVINYIKGSGYEKTHETREEQAARIEGEREKSKEDFARYYNFKTGKVEKGPTGHGIAYVVDPLKSKPMTFVPKVDSTDKRFILRDANKRMYEDVERGQYITMEEVAKRQAARKSTPTVARREEGWGLITTPDVKPETITGTKFDRVIPEFGGLKKQDVTLESTKTPIPGIGGDLDFATKGGDIMLAGLMSGAGMSKDTTRLGSEQQSSVFEGEYPKDSILSNLASRIALLNAQINNEKTKNFIVRDEKKIVALEAKREKISIVVDDVTGKQGTGQSLISPTSGVIKSSTDKNNIFNKLAEAKGLQKLSAQPKTFYEKAAGVASPALMQKIVSTEGTMGLLKPGDLDIKRTTPVDSKKLMDLKTDFSTTQVDIGSDDKSFGERVVEGSVPVKRKVVDIERDRDRRIEILNKYKDELQEEADTMSGEMSKAAELITKRNKDAAVDKVALDTKKEKLAQKLFVLETLSEVNDSIRTQVSYDNTIEAEKEYNQAIDEYNKEVGVYKAKYENDDYAKLVDETVMNEVRLQSILTEGEKLTSYGQQIYDASSKQIKAYRTKNDPLYKYSPTGGGERVLLPKDFGLSSKGKKTWLTHASDASEAIIRGSGHVVDRGVIGPMYRATKLKIEGMKEDVAAWKRGEKTEKTFKERLAQTTPGTLARAYYDWEDPKNAQYDWKTNVDWDGIKATGEAALLATLAGKALTVPAKAIPASVKYANRFLVSTITAKASASGMKKLGMITAPPVQQAIIKREDFGEAMRVGYQVETKDYGKIRSIISAVPGVQLGAGSKFGTKQFGWTSRDRFAQGIEDYYRKKGFKGDILEQTKAAALRQRGTGLWGELIGTASANVASEVWGQKMISEAFKTASGKQVGIGFLKAAPLIGASGTIEGAAVYVSSTEGRYQPFESSKMVDSMIWGGAIAGVTGGAIAGAKSKSIGGSFLRGKPTTRGPLAGTAGRGVELATYVADPWEKPGDIIAGVLSKKFPKLIGTASIKQRIPTRSFGSPFTFTGTPIPTSVDTPSVTYGGVSTPTSIVMDTPTPVPIQTPVDVKIKTFVGEPTPTSDISFSPTEVSTQIAKSTGTSTFTPTSTFTDVPTATTTNVPVEVPIPEPVIVPESIFTDTDTSTQTQTETQTTVPTGVQTGVSTSVLTSVPTSGDFAGQMPFGRGRYGGRGGLASSWLIENKIRDFAGEWITAQKQKTSIGLTGAGAGKGFMDELTPTQTVKQSDYIIPTGKESKGFTDALTSTQTSKTGKYIVPNASQMMMPQIATGQQMVMPQIATGQQMGMPQAGMGMQPFQQRYATTGKRYQPGMILQPGQIINQQGIVVIPQTGRQKAQGAVDKLFGKKGLNDQKIAGLMTVTQMKPSVMPRRPTQLRGRMTTQKRTSIGTMYPKMNMFKGKIGV